MRADQLVPAVVAAVAVVCLLVAGRVDGLGDYVPAAAANQEVAPQATTQNPGHYLRRLNYLPLHHHLLPRRFDDGGYVPTTEVAPEVTTDAGPTLSGSLGSGYSPQPEQTTTEPAMEQMSEPHPQQTPTSEAEAHTSDQGDFYRTGVTPDETPATYTSASSTYPNGY